MEEEKYKKWNKIVAKAWADEKFKKELIANPEKILKENGFQIPPDMKFKVHENTDKMINLVLPAKNKTLEEVDLASISGGVTICYSQSLIC